MSVRLGVKDGVKGAVKDALLRDVSLAVARGTTVAVLGPSGCGKSTLLRTIVGLSAVDVGRVRVDGVDPCGPERLSLQRRIGYVIQEGGLFPHLTARDNVALLVRHMGWPRARIDERIDVLTKLVRLDAGELARHPGQLSGGQRQRVALMRALMPDPDVLLLDEPLGALDPMVRAELQDELRRLLAQDFVELHKTTVLVTHDLAEAAHLAHLFVLMRDGAIVATGTLAELRTSSDAFVTRFLAAHRTLALPHEVSA